jgi:hypothetical protein
MCSNAELPEMSGRRKLHKNETKVKSNIMWSNAEWAICTPTYGIQIQNTFTKQLNTVPLAYIYRNFTCKSKRAHRSDKICAMLCAAFCFHLNQT